MYLDRAITYAIFVSCFAFFIFVVSVQVFFFANEYCYVDNNCIGGGSFVVVDGVVVYETCGMANKLYNKKENIYNRCKYSINWFNLYITFPLFAWFLGGQFDYVLYYKYVEKFDTSNNHF